MTLRLSISLDVPDLEQGISFYNTTFGFSELSRPLPVMALIEKDQQRILLLQKPEGSRPYQDAEATRIYTRHWTPIHLDFHSDDFDGCLARAQQMGAICEIVHEVPGRPRAAFMADPFGHGFCLIEA